MDDTYAISSYIAFPPIKYNIHHTSTSHKCMGANREAFQVLQFTIFVLQIMRDLFQYNKSHENLCKYYKSHENP